MFTINEDDILYGSWDIKAWDFDGESFLSFWVIFCPLTLLTTRKIKISKKWKKKTKNKKQNLKILAFYTCILQMMIIWYIVLQKWSATDRIFYQFGPFFALFLPLQPRKSKLWKNEKITINDNHIMYGSWDIKCDRQIFLSLWAIFCPFTPLTTQKIKILKKWKKCP